MTESCSTVPENQTWKCWYLGYTDGKREIYRIVKSKKITLLEKIFKIIKKGVWKVSVDLKYAFFTVLT